MSAIDRLIKTAEAEVGYLEKRSNMSLDDKTANAGRNNYTKYWRDIYPQYQGNAWCAGFVTWCMDRTFGKDKTKLLLKHYPFVYCPTLGALCKLNADPKRGDIVLFYRGGRFAHTGIVTKVSGDYFETIEGNTSGGSTIVENGGGVFKKSYYNSKLPGTKFVTPDWSLVNEKEELNMTQYEELKGLIEKQTKAMDEMTLTVKKLKEQADKKPMIYNYVDKNMPSWARDSVKWMSERGMIAGDGKGLALDDEKLWAATVIYRMGQYLAKLAGVKI